MPLACRPRSASRTISRSTREWPPSRAHARFQNTHGHPTPLSVCLTARCPLKHRRTHGRRDVAHIAARSARLDGYSRAAYSRYTIRRPRRRPLLSLSFGSSSFVVALTFGSSLLAVTSHISFLTVPLCTFSRSFVAQPGTPVRKSEAMYILRGTSSAKTPIEI